MLISEKTTSLLRLDLFYFFVTIPGTALSDYFNIEGSLLVRREKTKTLPPENRATRKKPENRATRNPISLPDIGKVFATHL